MAAVAVLPPRCDGDDVDRAAVEAIRKTLAKSDFSLNVISCEGAKDKAPRFFPGEVLGSSKGQPWEIAVDPVDGTRALVSGASKGRSMVAIAVGRPGTFPRVPECYFEHLLITHRLRKFAGGPHGVKPLLRRLSTGRSGTAAILSRPRNSPYLERLRRNGWRIREEATSELAAALDVTAGRQDLLAGIGGGPETLLMSVAALATGGLLVATPRPAGIRQINWLRQSDFRTGLIYSEKDFARKSAVLFTGEISR